MKMIITSVIFRNETGEKTYDLEMPCNVPSEILCRHICDAVRDYSGRVPISSGRLFCQRLNRVLAPEESLEKAGIWNGDILMLQ